MNALNKLLDDARKMCSRDSDAAIAERVKVSRNTLMQWRKGTVRITDDHLAALVELAKADELVMLQVRAEEANSTAARRAWSVLRDRLSAAAAVVALVVAGSLQGHGNTHEINELRAPTAGNLYIM